ncbi:plasmid partitioning protein RepB [Bradyrhizobium sp. 27S5]|uniref:plasmid partitioning protein RepB n=1 Tax=Bradyrhizobium sp. 27S5 TaxID=3139728 RepID=UPI0030D6086A
MTKKPGGKSIIASFGALSANAAEERDSPPASGHGEPPRPLGRVGAGIIGATQRTLQEMREERDRLQALVAKGGDQKLAPDTIDPSPFIDRLPDDGDADFRAFKASFSEQGQKVPILVRNHPSNPGRYQVVYGRRRLRAARELGMPIRALVADLSDHELALVQGIENSERQDLSWIERALFAAQMDAQGLRPRDIKAAVKADDAEMTKFRTVVQVVPDDVIRSIGRAPKTGRPRWTLLASLVKSDAAAGDRIRETLAAAKVSSSDERFQSALAAASSKVDDGEATAEISLQATNGPVIGKATFGRSGVRIQVQNEQGAAFATFLRQELPDLVERFIAQAR